MIVKTITDFCNISYDGNKIATSAHAAYWLACQHSIDCRSALETQEKDILDAFHKMADLLGYRVEKIEPEAHPEAKDEECGHPFLDDFKTAADCIGAHRCVCGAASRITTPSRLEHLAGMTPIAEAAE